MQKSVSSQLCLFGAFLLFLSSYVACELDGEGIIGGDYAVKQQFTYQVSLQVNGGRHFCGGSIIHERFILTAAHCVINSRTGGFYNRTYHVVANSVDLNIDFSIMIVGVKRAYVPWDYNWLYTRDDIAVLELSQDLYIGDDSILHLTKLDLPEDETVDYAGETAVVSGYGYTWVKLLFDVIGQKGGSDYKLKYASVNIVDTETCAKTNWPDKIDGNTQICGQLIQRDSENPEGICNGDSGSPLVVNNTVIGIVSTGPSGCRENKESAVYTRVSAYLPFIEQAMRGIVSSNTRVFDYPGYN